MAMPLALQNLSFVLNNGQTLFSQLTTQFSHRVCGLVGNNGVGKSVLAQMMAGRLPPSEGTVVAPQRVAYVPQQWPGEGSDNVLTVLGLQPIVDAISRIEQGSTSEQDFELAEGYWDWQTQLRSALDAVGFTQTIDLERSIQSYSGGEQFRFMWAAALLHQPDIFILDEPTNHLDQQGRLQLYRWIAHSRQPFILVTHDRQLLQSAEAIYELTASKIHGHPGDYELYFQGKQARWQQQQSDLSHARKQQKQTAAKAQQALEKQQQRTAQGKAKAKRENWSVLERDGAKQAAENSQRNEKLLRDNRQLHSQQASQLAESQREWFDPIGFELPASALSASKPVISLSEFCAGYSHALHSAINTRLHGPFRLHITGPNGTGKSAVLKAILSHEPTWHGQAQLHVPVAYLDQHFYGYDGTRSAIDNFLLQQPDMTEKEGRDRLSWLRLRNTKADVPFAALSGGEQLKVVLASKLLGRVTPQLLLLDEPTNHLDLDSIIALENALSAFKGALIIVSHDQYFVDRQAMTHRLQLGLEDTVIESV